MSTLDPVLARLAALHPKLIDLSLGRVRRLLERLGSPERRLPPAIHVAGTNGKGSTIAFMRSMLEAAGRRAHVYTSPHLVRFNERIVVGGATLPDGELLALLEECERANEDRPITFFEITTAAAFLAFSRAPADMLLLEVGLGGRLDTTNVIERPAVAAIAPVARDHTQFLGETLAEIAAEKAGIIKPGAPLVLAPQEAEARTVILAKAAAAGAPVYDDWRVSEGVFHGRRMTLALPALGLTGAHQAGNAGLALACLEGFGLAEEALLRGLQAAHWPARLQRLSEAPEIWLDGGHNPAAGRVLASWMAARGGGFDLVVGMLDTKDRDRFLAELAPHVERTATVPVPGSAASVPAEALAVTARAAGMDAAAAPDVETALKRLGGARSVLIAGSLYLAGAVLADFPAFSRPE